MIDENVIYVTQEQWDELQERLNQPSRKLPAIVKLFEEECKEGTMSGYPEDSAADQEERLRQSEDFKRILADLNKSDDDVFDVKKIFGKYQNAKKVPVLIELRVKMIVNACDFETKEEIESFYNNGGGGHCMSTEFDLIRASEEELSEYSMCDSCGRTKVEVLNMVPTEDEIKDYSFGKARYGLE